MKKIILSAFIFMVLAPFVFAQKNIDVDNTYFSYIVRLFPQSPENPIYYSYGKGVFFNSSASGMLNKEQIMDALAIQGENYDEKFTQTSAMFVKLFIDNPRIESIEVASKSVTNKDNTTTTTYFMKGKISGSSYVSVFKGGKEVWQKPIRLRNVQRDYAGQEFSNSKDCREFWRDNKETLIDQLTNQYAMEDVGTATRLLSYTFGFQLLTMQAMLETIDTKKHPENEQFRSNVNQVKTILASLDGNTPLTETQMQPFIDYFKSIPQKYADLSLKADIKIRYAAYYNLAQIYACMDKFTEAISYCDALIANVFDKKDGESLKTELLKTQSYLSDKSLQVRQFVPENSFGKQ